MTMTMIVIMIMNASIAMLMITVTILIVIVIVIERTLHVDAAVEIAVGLVDHREADRLPRPAESDRQRIIATDELRLRRLTVEQTDQSTQQEEM